MRARIQLLIFLLVTAVASARAIELPDEDMNYIIRYKWGLIEKHAATAILSLREDSEKYYAKMAVATLPWADHILTVRDTLISVMERPSCRPLIYMKHTHQGDEVEIDRVDYSYSGKRTIGTARRFKQNGNERAERSDTTIYSHGTTLDMLSVFYWLRELDMPALEKGEQFHVTLFSAWMSRDLTVTYLGRENVEFENNVWDTYAFRFNFTKNGQVVEKPMYVWISTDTYRIPVKLVGVLPLGHVEAYYTGQVAQ